MFQVQQQNRLKQKGLLRRFSINCYGHQETLEEMRAEKAEKFLELKHTRNSKEYEEWFLRYRPSDKKPNPDDKKNNTQTKTKKQNTNTKNTNKGTKKKAPQGKTKKRGRGGLFF